MSEEERKGGREGGRDREGGRVSESVCVCVHVFMSNLAFYYIIKH